MLLASEPGGGRRGQRSVQHVHQRLVLPEADSEHDEHVAPQTKIRAAQLVEMIDDAQPLLMADRPQGFMVVR